MDLVHGIEFNPGKFTPAIDFALNLISQGSFLLLCSVRYHATRSGWKNIKPAFPLVGGRLGKGALAFWVFKGSGVFRDRKSFGVYWGFFLFGVLEYWGFGSGRFWWLKERRFSGTGKAFNDF